VESVTVLHRECVRADALCTALAVMGADAGLAWADDAGLAALIMLREGDRLVERQSRAFAALLD
jgi:FAD:protein FMN transferase